MSRFIGWVEREYGSELADLYEKYSLPDRIVKDFVEEESEEVADEIVKKILADLDRENLDRDVDDIIAEYDDRIREEVDVLLTWNLDNILVAYAYSGEYCPEILATVPNTIEEYALAVAYEVWYDKIWEKVRSKLEKAIEEGVAK